MLKKIHQIGMFAGLLVVMASVARAETIPFTPPAARPQRAANSPWPKDKFLVLAYHDVEDIAADQRYLSVRTSALNDQMAWLKQNGYNAISVQDILDANQGHKTLPPKAVLLSFDDGYSSFYYRVWPLLEAYRIPALWAPVGKWVDGPAKQPIDFGGLITPREKFATWEMIHEVSRSSLIEIGSHTWGAHLGIVANPQGSKEPAVANRSYDPQTGKYETDEQFNQRIDADVQKITQKLAQVTGNQPRAWVWPYGAANGTTLSIAKKHGYKMAFSLDEGLADINQLDNIPRVLISGNPSLKSFSSTIASVQEKSPVRVMHVDLDYVYDRDPAQQSRNIDKLIQRVFDMKITHVFLQAFADPDGDGTVKSLYFPNRHLPVRADLFNYISWQLQSRVGVKVFAWMPVLAFDLDPSLSRVASWNPKSNEISPSSQPYIRLSPWDPKVRGALNDIYADLAKYSTFKGVLFHDDATLSDYEDASPAALNAYQKAGFPGSIAGIRENPLVFKRWTRFKSKALVDLTRQLTHTLRDIRGPQVKTARNIFAMPILEPESEAWYAQNMDDFLASYDWTVPMAMPLMENIPLDQSSSWLVRLIKTIAGKNNGLNKTIIELQAKDWRAKEQRAISGEQLADWMTLLQINGVKSFGYYPDDFITDQPKLSAVKPAFSTYWYPQND